MAVIAPEPRQYDRAKSAEERAAIDASCRGPVLLFASSAVLWLLVGSALALLASIKLHSPYFLTGSAELTFGRARMAHLQSVGIGWSSLAAVAACLWLMCRLSRAELIYPKMLYLAGALWNVGVFLAVFGILFGDGQSVEWLDAPPYAPPFFVAALGLVSAWTVATFRRRRELHVYVTQWYILGAVFWFPWLYLVAQFVIFWMPVPGVVQPIVNWWFGHNVLGLWFTPVAVGTAYYLIPKIIGRPVHSYYLSIIGFWALALFYSWAGMHHLIGGPIPAWLATASTVGSMMMFIPVIAVAINHHMTMLGHFQRLRYSPALRFTVFGSISYTVVSFQGSLMALKDFSETAHFTHYIVAHAHLGAYAFVTMIFFGLFYYMVPRLTGREWPSSTLIRVHFWCAAVGITAYFAALSIGGWWQGRMMNNPDVPFAKIVLYTQPHLFARSVAGILLTTGHIAFATSFVMNLAGWGQKRTGPTFFVEPAERKL
ncbi:cbb3-type cytochrome c oxidase subunit I [Gemmata sp. G18]|uniref:Cbb3-type cytochrome c oxidase subunit I n=1 Tax=Gemmata palustris TaxID=2822762 RepID=A0ABS5C2A2_9BACT|nr:cbb3-type cytochrome c oxidase subunit I [Gemmata palustris]MBP3959263.1 cbb3-type cytochrome c oxidase subunit I [Gemmata palustris]